MSISICRYMCIYIYIYTHTHTHTARLKCNKVHSLLRMHRTYRSTNPCPREKNNKANQLSEATLSHKAPTRSLHAEKSFLDLNLKMRYLLNRRCDFRSVWSMLLEKIYRTKWDPWTIYFNNIFKTIYNCNYMHSELQSQK